MYKSKLRILIFITALILNSCEPNNAQITVVEAFTNLNFSSPVDIQTSDDGTNRLFVVSQQGKIHVFNNNPDVTSSSVFLDIEDRVLFGGEQGLLGLAFHPNFKSNGYFYVNYTAGNPRRTVISRFKQSEVNANIADINSELIMLEVPQPYSNHNGGQLSFGPDRYLYISFGDGGSGGDPENRAQNLSSLLGKILRIDVDNTSQGITYSIPPGNPFVGTSNAREEIFAYGLRNVWRFSFDSSGKLWAADVGQNAWEEIDIIENGGNYGWRIMEGFHCFNPSNNCDQEGLRKPIHEYGHNSNGGYSITGGFLYEGINVPSLNTKYIYADFVSGNIWSLNPVDTVSALITKFNGQISTFGIDENKELYFADYGSGKIYKFIENVNRVGELNPLDFKLHQNYPNPFNPSTTISYTLGKSGSHNQTVQLSIINSLGQKIVTLVNQDQSPGNYNVTFNGSNNSSGIYLYKLRYGNSVQLNRMVLLK